MFKGCIGAGESGIRGHPDFAGRILQNAVHGVIGKSVLTADLAAFARRGFVLSEAFFLGPEQYPAVTQFTNIDIISGRGRYALGGICISDRQAPESASKGGQIYVSVTSFAYIPDEKIPGQAGGEALQRGAFVVVAVETAVLGPYPEIVATVLPDYIYIIDSQRGV